MPIPDPAAGQKAVSAMFGRIAPGYDAANRILSLGVDSLWRRRLLADVIQELRPGPDRTILDLAAGTYDVSLALAAGIPDAAILAVDFCLPMLLAGKGKILRAGTAVAQRIRPLAGDGLRLPLHDASVDAVTVSFGLRNMRPRQTAMQEIWRVLAPGGSCHILEFGSAQSRIWGGLYNLYLTRLLPCIGGLVTGDKEAYDYLARTIGEFPTAEILAEELRQAGFCAVRARRLWGGIVYLHTGKKSASPEDAPPRGSAFSSHKDAT